MNPEEKELYALICANLISEFRDFFPRIITEPLAAADSTPTPGTGGPRSLPLHLPKLLFSSRPHLFRQQQMALLPIRVPPLVLHLPWARALLVLYLLLNLKSLPFVWHLRVFYHLFSNIRRHPVSLPRPLSLARNDRRRISSHPLFQPVSLMTRTPLLETDYNLHKSNATYLTDMDVSRTKLISPLFSPGWRKLNAELEEQGHSKKGRMVIALGGVHVTFRRELGIYERVEVRSRVLGWDDKWTVILTCFVRKKGGKGEEELCAAGLSKYVVKKGRFTVVPERVLGMAGWLPSRAKGTNDSAQNGVIEAMNGAVSKRTGADQPAASPAPTGDASKSDRPQEENAAGTEGLEEIQVPQAAEKAVLEVEQAAAAISDDVGRSTTVLDTEAWSWEEVEEERRRGLEIAKNWLALDAGLDQEFSRH